MSFSFFTEPQGHTAKGVIDFLAGEYVTNILEYVGMSKSSDGRMKMLQSQYIPTTNYSYLTCIMTYIAQGNSNLPQLFLGTLTLKMLKQITVEITKNNRGEFEFSCVSGLCMFIQRWFQDFQFEISVTRVDMKKKYCCSVMELN